MSDIDLPQRVVVGANGAYWRDYGTHYSMCPVSEDNDPVEVVAVYEVVPKGRLDVERLARPFEGGNYLQAYDHRSGRWLDAREAAVTIAREYEQAHANEASDDT